LDDFVLLLTARSATELLDHIEVPTSTALEVARSFDIKLNFSESKWEGVEVLVGPLAKATKQRPVALGEADQLGKRVPSLPLSSGGFLRIVSSCKHLGVIAASGAAMDQELDVRTTAARATYSVLVWPLPAE
jgi:hypothetical protein